MTDLPTDADVFARAQELQKQNPGLDIAEAVAKAQEILTPKPKLQTEFEITIKLKRREADFIRETFDGHDTLSIEDRLGAWVAMVMAREISSARTRNRAKPQLGESSGVTLSRADFEKQKGS